jgi:hypothetical protein
MGTSAFFIRDTITGLSARGVGVMVVPTMTPATTRQKTAAADLLAARRARPITPLRLPC